MSRVIRLEFDDAFPGVSPHNRRVWFTVEDNLNCVADLQFEIMSKLVDHSSIDTKNCIYLTFNEYTLLPDQKISPLLLNSDVLIQVKQLPDSLAVKSKKRKRRSKGGNPKAALLRSTDMNGSQDTSKNSFKSEGVMICSNLYNNIIEGPPASVNQVQMTSVPKPPKNLTTSWENDRKGEYTQRSKPSAVGTSKGIDTINTSASCRSRTDTGRHTYFDSCGELESDNKTYNNKTEVEDRKPAGPQPPKISNKNDAPAWITSGLRKKEKRDERPETVSTEDKLSRKKHNQLPPVPFSQFNNAFSAESRPPLPPTPYPYTTVLTEKKEISTTPTSLQSATNGYEYGRESRNGNENSTPKRNEIDEEEDVLEMGFENMHTPGKKKRPYSIIVSQHSQKSQQDFTECQSNSICNTGKMVDNSGELMKIPVPRFYNLQVGECISYTCTKLDEDNWEPITSSPIEGTIVQVIEAEGSNPKSDPRCPESVSYVVSTSDDNSTCIRWVDISECWVLRESEYKPPSFSPFLSDNKVSKTSSSMSPAHEFTVDNFLERLSVKRSLLK